MDYIITTEQLTKKYKSFVAVGDILYIFGKGAFTVSWDRTEQESLQP